MATFTALVGCFPAFAASSLNSDWSGVVTYVVDGDTVRVRPKSARPAAPWPGMRSSAASWASA